MTSERIEREDGGYAVALDHGDRVQTVEITSCPNCGSRRLYAEERDPVEHGSPPRPESYGTWILCDGCGHEWPGRE